MKMWRKIGTKEVVFEEDAEEYVFDQLGIEMDFKGKNGTYTLEQEEAKLAIIEWYFSGDWILEDREYNDYEEVI